MQGALIAAAGNGGRPSTSTRGAMKIKPQEVADFFLSRGAPMNRLVLSHIDLARSLTKAGCSNGRHGMRHRIRSVRMEQSYYPHSDIDMPNDAIRLRLLRKLIENGHLDQIVISHDICHRTRLTRYGGHG
jgi:phosphotriesterase-related protein